MEEESEEDSQEAQKSKKKEKTGVGTAGREKEKDEENEREEEEEKEEEKPQWGGRATGKWSGRIKGGKMAGSKLGDLPFASVGRTLGLILIGPARALWLRSCSPRHTQAGSQ